MGTVTSLTRPNDAGTSARIDVAAALRWAARLNMNESIHNHFTLAIPGVENRYVVNPNTIHWSEMKAGDLCIVDGDGNLISGDHEVSRTAFSIHGAIHKTRPDAKCVLHTHMPHATALTMIEGWRMEFNHQNACRFWNRLAYDDDTGFKGLAFDDSEAVRMAAALGDKRVLVLANHGIIVTGETIAEAFDDLYYFEKLAELQVLAMSTGRKLKPIDETVVALTEQQMNSTKLKTSDFHFNALKRILDRQEPEYADL